MYAAAPMVNPHIPSFMAMDVGGCKNRRIEPALQGWTSVRSERTFRHDQLRAVLAAARIDHPAVHGCNGAAGPGRTAAQRSRQAAAREESWPCHRGVMDREQRLVDAPGAVRRLQNLAAARLRPDVPARWPGP